MIRTPSARVKADQPPFTRCLLHSYDGSPLFAWMPSPLARTAVLALVALASTPALAEPELSGAWRSELGVLRLDSTEGRLTGHYEEGGACGFLPERRVLEGNFEGDVLVGTVILCQSGTACGEKVYPILGFYNPAARSLSAHVRLDPGCSSPALRDGLLSFQAVETAEAPKHTSSAAQLARMKTSRRDAEGQARKAFALARRMLERGDFKGARAQLEMGLSYDDDNWAAYIQLGVAQMHLDNPRGAVEAYQRAIALNGKDPIAYFNLACAFSRLNDRGRAMEFLRLAIRHGFAEASAMSTDKDLTRMFHDDPEFKQLLSRAWDHSTKGRKRKQR